MPKIQSLEIKAFEYPLAPGKAYGMARTMNVARTCSIVEVTTDEGVVGYGEASGPPHAVRDYLAIASPFFTGRSIYDFEIVAAQLYNRFYHFGVQNHLTSCLSGISIALHDAIGKTLGVALHDLIGGRACDDLMCYATSGVFTADDSDGQFETQIETVKQRGYRAVKIKVGKSPKSDRDRVRMARNILGDDVLLMVDANGNYTPDTAYESIRLIDPFDVHWFEEPLPPTDVRGYADLHTRSPVRLAAGEACYTVHDFRRLIDANGIDILQPAIVTCGGVGQAKAIALLAAMNNLRVAPNGWGGAVAMAVTLHFAASLPIAPHTDYVPYPVMIEFHTGENPLYDTMLKTPFDSDGHRIAVPTGPGLGIELDLAGAAEYAIAF